MVYPLDGYQLTPLSNQEVTPSIEPSLNCKLRAGVAAHKVPHHTVVPVVLPVVPVVVVSTSSTGSYRVFGGNGMWT